MSLGTQNKTKDISLSKRNQHRLRNRADQLKPAIELSEPFTSADIGKVTEIDHAAGVVYMLKSMGAIIQVDETKQGNRGAYVGMYEWDEKVRDWLIELLDGMQTLPCGHRAHVFNDPELATDRLGCKHCVKNRNEHPSYSKASVRELL